MKKTVKLLAIVSALTMLFAFAGCNRNNGNTGNESQVSTVSEQEQSLDPLAGQWQSEQLSDYIYTFNGDGTGKYDMAGKVLELNYTLENDKITLTFLEEGYTPVTLDYELDGDRLNIKDSFGKDTFYVKVKADKVSE